MLKRQWKFWSFGGAGCVACLVLAVAGCMTPSAPAPPPPATKTPTPSTPAATPVTPRPPATTDLDRLTARVRLGEVPEALIVGLAGEGRIPGEDGRQRSLAPGRYEVRAIGAVPARQHWHVFPKTFELHERAAEEAYLAAWRARGHDPRIEVFGKRIATRGGRAIDNRTHWVSLARFAEERQATALRDSLQGESVWAWIRPETVAPGRATLVFRPLDGQPGGEVRSVAPGTLESTQHVKLYSLDRGFWQERRDNFVAPGAIDFGIGPDGALEVTATLPLEEYLRGVLPAEMPVSWPAAALEAQAVAARSEALANLATKHRLEGFDFCAREHCRAYGGFGIHAPSTDQALRATAGDVLVAGGKAVPTVYSANCGGWTEHNENVWAGPPNASLRGVADGPAAYGRGAANATAWGLDRFLRETPAAYCSADGANFRWTREFSLAEASRLVNQHHAVGTLTAIEPGARGVSGRLRSLRVVGTAGSATIERELAIRRAFGGLPSALFTVTIDRNRGTVTFRGAGRGHGVGLCQHGARGMAAAGHDYRDIVLHYFAAAAIEKVQ